MTIGSTTVNAGGWSRAAGASSSGAGPVVRSGWWAGAQSTHVARLRVPTEADSPSWLDAVCGGLGELRQLLVQPEDDVPTPYPEALDRALGEVLRVLSPDSPIPSVVPTEDGNVLFVWHTHDWDLHVEVGPATTEVWARRPEEPTLFLGPIDDYQEQMRRILAGEQP